jgi:probable HAF family extracellular repeat protein
MPSRLPLPLALTLAFASLAAQAAPPRYTLAEVPQGTFIYESANQVNATGTIGGSGYAADGIMHAFSLAPGGVPVVLDPLGGGTSRGAALNDAGDIVGAATVPGDPNHTHAFLIHGGVATDLTHDTGRSFSDAVGVGGDGTVVGNTSTATHLLGEAFVWRNGQLTTLGTMAGGRSSVAQAVNAAGLVVGASAIAPTQDFHAFVFDRRMHDLGTLGGAQSNALAINAAGTAVGWALTPAPSKLHAVSWSAKRRITDLGTLEPGNPDSTSEAIAVNDAGLIVGAASSADGGRGFIVQGHRMYDLNRFVNGLPAGARITSGDSITAAGVILASLTDVNGTPHSVLLTPVASR